MVNKSIGTNWIRRIGGFISLVAMVSLSLAFGTLMLGLISIGLAWFAVKYWLLHRRLRAGEQKDWQHQVIEGEYRVIEHSTGKPDGQTRR